MYLFAYFLTNELPYSMENPSTPDSWNMRTIEQMLSSRFHLPPIVIARLKVLFTRHKEASRAFKNFCEDVSFDRDLLSSRLVQAVYSSPFGSNAETSKYITEIQSAEFVEVVLYHAQKSELLDQSPGNYRQNITLSDLILCQRFDLNSGHYLFFMKPDTSTEKKPISFFIDQQQRQQSYFAIRTLDED
jgi:hypothetical protein